MRKSLKLLTSLGLVFLIVGCGGKEPLPKSKLNTTKEFNINYIDVALIQLHKPKIKYYTEDELREIFQSKLIENLKKEKLYSTNKGLTKLSVELFYKRRFVGDETFIKTDSLGSPQFSYVINIFDQNDELIHRIERDNFTIRSGFNKNLQIIAGTLRTNEEENGFLNAMVETVTKDIMNIE